MRTTIIKKWSIFVLCALMLNLFVGCGGNDVAETTEPTQYIPRETPETKFHEPATDFAGGSGTEEDPYQISDVSHLVLLNQRMVEEYEDHSFDDTYTDAYYILTADITLNNTADFEDWAESAPEYGWEPIGWTANNFGGTFDGNGHIIRGMYINVDANIADVDDRYYGLFASVTGTVKNLTVEESYICVSGNVAYVGAIAGRLLLDDGYVENCTSNAVLTVYDSASTGGITGEGGVIKDCVFGGTITQMDDSWCHLGGISGSKAFIIGCTNLGVVSGKGYSGGIVGFGDRVENSVNKGVVRGDTAGGISGNVFEVATGLEFEYDEVGLINCTNEGEVYGVTLAGGIAGNVNHDEADLALRISACTNFGKVVCDQVSSGIVGRLTVGRASVLNIENCTNHADITGAGKVGGIICELQGSILHQEGNVTITGCENHGNITSTEGMYSGGIVTYLMLMGDETNLRLTIADCANHGTITSQSNAGGILCFTNSTFGLSNISDTSNITLRGCTNAGEILGLSSNSFVGGIAAIFSAEGIPAIFENCTNTGNVRLELSLTEEDIQTTVESGSVMTLSQMVGGIVGRLGDGLLLTTDHDVGSVSNVNAENAWIVFRNCHNSGTLGATDFSEYTSENGTQIWKNYIGGIIGNTCAEDAYSFRVEDCTYSGADRGLGNREYPDVGTRE